MKMNGVTEPFTVGRLYVAAMRPVMIWGRAEVPAVHGMECPGASFVRFFRGLAHCTPLVQVAFYYNRMVHLNGHTLKLLVLHLTGEEDLFMLSLFGVKVYPRVSWENLLRLQYFENEP